MASRFFINSKKIFSQRVIFSSLFTSSLLLTSSSWKSACEKKDYDSYFPSWSDDKTSSYSTSIDSNSPKPSESSQDTLLSKLNNSLLNEFNNYIPDVIENVMPGVVNIAYGAKGYMYSGTYTGSGFIISDKGYIVTNAHVIANCSSGVVKVTYYNGATAKAQIYAYDSISDIAILKIVDKDLEKYPIVNKFNVDNDELLNIVDPNQSFIFKSNQEINTDSKLTSLKLGSSTKLRQGQFVIAIGSPLYLKNSSSLGIVSSALRDSSDLLMNVKAKHRTSYIQTDAAINTGNSGGPLINLFGEVIGINTMKAKDTDGISFAISIDFAKEIIKQLIKNRKVIRPYIGLKLSNILISPEDKNSKPIISDKSSPFNNDMTSQIIVLDIVKNSPAHKAGFEKNDIILEINNEKVNDIKVLLNSIGLEVGKEFEFKISRNNTIKTLRLVTTPDSY